VDVICHFWERVHLFFHDSVSPSLFMYRTLNDLIVYEFDAQFADVLWCLVNFVRRLLCIIKCGRLFVSDTRLVDSVIIYILLMKLSEHYLCIYVKCV